VNNQKPLHTFDMDKGTYNEKQKKKSYWNFQS
jgi:hypothetical protein